MGCDSVAACEWGDCQTPTLHFNPAASVSAARIQKPVKALALTSRQSFREGVHMSKRSKHDVAEIDGVDLDFRPRSYWADADPISAIVQNIKGQNRREMARDFIAGDVPKAWGEIDPGLLDDTLSAERRVSLGQIDPSFMGGEYLPDYRRAEVEIARIVLQSATSDVYSLRARTGARGTRIRYRFVDEYESTFFLTPATSRRPLTMSQLIALIDTAESESVETLGHPFVESMAYWQFEGGASVQDALDFVSVESSVYPQLGDYYTRRLDAWADAYRREEADEDEDDGGIIITGVQPPPASS